MIKKRMLAPVAVACAMLFGGAFATGPAQAQDKVFRMVPYADLKILDPMFTTSYITRNFGYMVYDTLFSMNAKGEPKPQMVESWETSPDKKTWTFKLRSGLKFSDGAPVKAADCVASLKRWQARDNIGHAMTQAGGQWSVVDDNTFQLTLASPFGLVLDGLAKVSSYPAFIMPERLANRSDGKPLTDVVGSGPYLFKKDEWMPGSKVVFVRNPAYSPRKEAPDGLSGSRASNMDRVEWVILPDSNSAIAALKSKEVDMIEQVPPDFISTLRDDKNLITGKLNRQQVYVALNHAIPPFNNAKARLALAHAIDQNNTTAAMGYPDDIRVKHCDTFFICGGPNATSAGSAAFAKPDLALAKKLLAESGYKGEKIAMLLPADVAYLNAATLVTAQAMQSIGMKVDLQSMDWSTLTARRAKKSPVNEGGWNAFVSSAAEFNVDSPINNTYLGASCGNSLPGWPCDEELDKLRAKWIAATDPAERKKLLDAFQEEAWKTIPNLPIGQYSVVFSTQKNIKNTDKLWGVPNVWVLDR
ncbi:MAG: ABC transporter substrate-binding protein [Burkholderiaceae bacterium]